MSELANMLEFWPVRAIVIGGAVLLLGRLAMLTTRQPSRRVVIGVAALACSLLALPLSLLPGWLPIPVAAPMASSAERPALATDAAAAASADVADLAAIAPFVPTPNGVVVVAPESPAGGVESVAAAAIDQQIYTSASVAIPAWERLALIAYVVIAISFLAKLIVGHLGLARLWRTASPPPAWADELFRGLAATTCHRARLRCANRGAGPVCFGIRSPVVLVPAPLVVPGRAGELRCIMAHELSHLARRDPLAGWLIGIARAVYFVCPWFASLRRTMRLAQEQLADADAVRHAANPAEYAELLIRMTRARPAPLGATAVRGTTSELYRRVTMLLRNPHGVESRCPRRWLIGVSGALAAFAVAVAGIYFQPRSLTAAEPAKKDAAKPAAKPDTIKDLIEKLKKDAGDDPEKAKQIEELEKSLKPNPDQADPRSKVLPLPPPVIALPQLIDPDLPEDKLLKELMGQQGDLLRQLEQILGQVQGNRGVFVGGPDGVLRPLRGGGRLGVRVEKPSDVIASQLELPNGQGLVCVDVPADSTAGKIGIKPNDILLEVAGKAVPNDVATFVRSLRDIKPDAAIDIIVLRKGKKETLKGVKLPEAKEVAEVPVFPGFPNIEAVPLPLELPLPPALPLPPRLPPPPPLPGGIGVGVIAGPGESVRVEQVNDAFTILYAKNDIKVTITGSKLADAAPVVESIAVDDKGKTTKAESIDKLPKEYQDLAKAALKAIK